MPLTMMIDDSLYVPRAKKSLGQNFLRDRNIAAKIVAALDIQRHDRVLEIGPGSGALARYILPRSPAFFAALEKDAHWAKQLSTLAGKHGQGHIHSILTDALTFAWERLRPAFAWKIIGNLPYNVASPLMWDIAHRADGCGYAVFMVQKEVALRVAAHPGTSAYGALSIWIQSFVEPCYLFTVGPHAFTPRPRVDSSVISFSRHGQAFGFSPDHLAWTLRLCFQQRRKQMQGILRTAGYPAGKIMETIKISGRSRPEELTVQDFHALSQALANMRNSENFFSEA